MANPLEVIEQALERRGISAAAASEAAFGHPQQIASMRASIAAGRDTRFTYKSLAALAEVLDLELYFGPRRDRPQPTLALPGPDAAGLGESVGDFDPAPAWPNQLVALPLDLRGWTGPDRPEAAPVGFRLDFLRSLGPAIESLSLVLADLPASAALPPGPAILLVRSDAQRQGHGLWAWRDPSRVRVGRLTWLSRDHAVVADLDLSLPPAAVSMASGTFLPLGPVLWMGRVIPQPETGDPT